METLGVLGVYGGLLCGILGWYFGRRKAKKNNGIDELYHFLLGKSHSFTWYMTLGALYVLMSLYIFGIDIGVMPTLSIVLLVHVGGWGTSLIILNAKYSDESFSLSKLRNIFVIIICAVLATLFLVISILQEDWRFIIGAVVPVVISILMLISHAKEKNI